MFERLITAVRRAVRGIRKALVPLWHKTVTIVKRHVTRTRQDPAYRQGVQAIFDSAMFVPGPLGAVLRMTGQVNIILVKVVP